MFNIVFVLFMGFFVDEKVIKESEEKFGEVFDVYEVQFLKNEYLVGDFVSLVDLVYFFFIEYFVGVIGKGYMIKDRKYVSVWWDKISNCVVWKEVFEKYVLLVQKEKKNNEMWFVCCCYVDLGFV